MKKRMGNDSADDRAILDQVITKIGKQRIHVIYLTWGEGQYQWKEGETVDLLHFLREITFDYTWKAIFTAIDESKARQARKPKTAKRKVA